jgi:hypothetical protein
VPGQTLCKERQTIRQIGGGLPADHQWQLYAFAKPAGHYGIRFNGAWVDIGALAPVQSSTIRSIRVIFSHGHDNSDRLVRLDI